VKEEIFHITYTLTEEEFISLNQTIAEVGRRKERNRQLPLAIVEAVAAVAMLVIIFAGGNVGQPIAWVLFAFLALMSLWSFVRYPLIEGQKVKKSARKKYQERKLGERLFEVKLYDGSASELAEGKEATFRYRDGLAIIRAGIGYILIFQKNRSIFLPMRQVEELEGFGAYLDRVCEKYEPRQFQAK